MARLLASTLFASLLFFASPALAGSIQTLGDDESEGSSLSELGTKEDKKDKPALRLGSLRTGDAALPPRKLTKHQRQRLRAKRAARNPVVAKAPANKIRVNKAKVRNRLAIRAKRAAARRARLKN